MQGKTVGEQLMEMILYADDLSLMFQDQRSLEMGSELLYEIFTRYNLILNLAKKKTATMILTPKEVENYPETLIEINGNRIENVESFILLGSKIYQDSTKSTNLAINQRIALAMKKFSSNAQKLQNKHIPIKLRIIFLNSIVRSVLLYAVEAMYLPPNATTKIGIGIHSSPA